MMVAKRGDRMSTVILPIYDIDGNFAIYKRDEDQTSYVLDNHPKPSEVPDSEEYSNKYAYVLNNIILREKRQLIKDIFFGEYIP